MNHNWTFKRITDVYKPLVGLKPNKVISDSGFPFLSYKTVYNNIFIPEQLSDCILSNPYDQHLYSIENGDVFLTRTSELKNELAISCVSLKDYPFATFSNFVKRLRPKEGGLIYPSYAAAYFRSNYFRRKATEITYMTTRASLNDEMLSRLYIAYPSMQEQMKLGNLIRTLNQKIVNNNKLICLMENLLSAVYADTFLDYSKVNVFSDTPLGRIPSDWNIKSLDELGSINVSMNMPDDQNVREIIENNNTGESYKFARSIETDHKKTAMNKLLPDGAIVFRKPTLVSHMFITTGTLLVRESLNTIIPDESVGTPYLYYSFQYSAYRIEKALAGTTHRKITTKDLSKITLVVASKDKIKWFNNFCLMPFKKQLALQNENECLRFLMEEIIETFITQKIVRQTEGRL